MRRNKQIQEKYLYFAITGGTEVLANDAGQAIQLTTSTTDPVPPGTDAYAKGVFEVQLNVVNAAHAFGTAYNSPVAGTAVTIKKESIASYHASNGTLTFTTVSADAVNGYTVSSTANHNDYTVTQLLPIDTVDCMMYPASRMTGIQMVNATSAKVFFESVTGDVDSTDQVLVTFASGKYKEFCQTMNDAISDNKRQSNVIDVADVMSGTFLNGNPSTVSAVAFTLDT